MLLETLILLLPVFTVLPKSFSSHLNGIFGSSDHMVLERRIQFVEIAAPPPNTHDQIRVLSGVFLRVNELFAVDGVYLELVSANQNKALDKARNLFDAIRIAEGRVMDLSRERAAVGDSF